jgi:hypothetical protein
MRLYLRGDASELSGTVKGSVINPNVAPAGLTGTVVANNGGSVNLVPGDGVYFLNCCSNTSNAYFKFTGAAVGSLFSLPQGQISVTLKSRYSFAQRQSVAAAARTAFDIRDANGHQFYFTSQVVSGYLVFYYLVQGVSRYYYVPKGTEDQIFGSGVSLKVALAWNGNTVTLYLNGVAVSSAAYSPVAANWSAASLLDVGAYEYLTYGGYNGFDDLIRDFTVTDMSVAGTVAGQ